MAIEWKNSIASRLIYAVGYVMQTYLGAPRLLKGHTLKHCEVQGISVLLYLSLTYCKVDDSVRRGLIELKIISMRIPQIEVPFGYEDKKAKKHSFEYMEY